ncbi:hypothetical protein AQUCO_00400620v1 [Aquilegia coerulea]|uniref:Uncharacterized protein n=1 Tax=Aquilegia coerulea TaxID=218851 RepID=A0A2G5EVY4_AQUCA|nr:hypothetical protein AQUCO_00400620v1 [Aquilegia coerulea]
MEFLGIHQANYLEAFKGLSDPCPLVIDNAVNEIFRVMENLVFGAVIFKGWKEEDNEIGKERVLKYVAKRAMEAKSFDVVIWMIEKRNASSIRRFQMRVAEQLGIAFSKNNDSDDDDEEGDKGTVDEIISRRIAACLEQKKFVLVHNGIWEFSDLMRMGIPVGRGAVYAMVLVVSNEVREYHKLVLMKTLSKQEVWDLVQEECVDIANCPSLRISGITPNDVMGCIICTFCTTYTTLSYRVRFWFAEGLIGGVSFDLTTTFGFGRVILEEFVDHCIIGRDEENIRSNISDAISERLESKGYPHLTVLGISGPEDYGYLGADWRQKSVKSVKSLSPQVLSTLSKVIFAWNHKKELPEDLFDNMTNVRTIDLSKTWIQSLPPSIVCLTNLRFLNLHSCKDLKPHQLYILRDLKKIEILDLSDNLFKEFPDNIFQGLDSLRLLDLSECSQLYSLPSSLFCLTNLEHLYLRSCENLSVLPSSTQGLEKLQVLEMTRTKLIEIPDQFFQSMCSLKELDLSFNLLLSQLSFKNCSSLETVTLSSNKNLEKLDLSSPKLKQFPIHGDQNLVCLKQLDLLNTKYLITVDWKDIKWLPQEVNWAQCGDGTTSHMYIQPFERSKDRNRDGVFISVGNANIFRTLSPSSALWEKSLSRFVVYVCPCEEHGKGKALAIWRAPLRYDDIFSKIKRSIPSYERCLEIEKVKRLPKGISGILSHAQFFILHDEKIIMRLSDLGVENMGMLRECLLERCDAMQAVFSVGANDLALHQPLLKCLEKLQIFSLMKLTHMCVSDRKLGKGSFSQLKYLHIEHCPQLVNVFSSSVCLKSLEVLEIKFCARLEEIFSGKENEEGSLQRLQTLCLLELPALKNIIHNVWLVSLNNAKVKGCPRLRELPLRSDNNIQNNNKLQKVPSIVVKCELEWWEQLEWKDKNVKEQVSFNSWKPFQFPPRG